MSFALCSDGSQASTISLSSCANELAERLNPPASLMKRLLAFPSSVRLGPQIGGSGAGAGEEAGEDGLDDGAEDDLGAVGDGQSHPQNQDEFEGIVEREPVNGVDQALEDIKECVDHPVSQPLGIVSLAGAEQSLERVVSRKDETSKVDEEGASEVEEDEEEVQAAEGEDHVDLGNTGLLLKIVENVIFGQLLIEL